MHKTVTIHPILGLISIFRTLPSFFSDFSNIVISFSKPFEWSLYLSISLELLLSLPSCNSDHSLTLIRFLCLLSFVYSFALTLFFFLHVGVCVWAVSVSMFACWYCTCSRILKFLIHDQDFYNLYVFVFVSMIWILNRFQLHDIYPSGMQYQQQAYFTQSKDALGAQRSKSKEQHIDSLNHSTIRPRICRFVTVFTVQSMCSCHEKSMRNWICGEKELLTVEKIHIISVT